MEQIQGFPKNLAYNLKRLSGSIIKQKIAISPDKSEYGPNERCQFNFPLGRMYDSRSIVLTAKCDTLTNGNFFPRGGLNSLIENLQISINSKIIQSTFYYNMIWNLLADCSGYFSPEQASKRLYENFDPSIIHTNKSGEGTVITSLACTTTGSTSTDNYFCVNQWLGFLSSSASVLDTNNLGQIQLVITWAPNSALWLAATNTPGTGASVGNYKISDLNLTMDTITFTESLYFDMIKEKLESDGLNVAYNDYLVSTGNLVEKSALTSVSAQFSTNSLDAVYATFRTELYNTANVLLLGNATVAAAAASMGGSSLTYTEVIGNTLSNEGNHGGFNQCRYFQRSGGGISSSSWYINSQPFTVNSSPISIYNNLLQTLDYANLDIASGGFHAGAMTSGIYNRYYFVDAISLENISGDGNNWISGYQGGGGITQVQYNPKFLSAVGTEKVFPVLIAKVSKKMNIKIGRNIDIME
jgi:hypothetical protein